MPIVEVRSRLSQVLCARVLIQVPVAAPRQQVRVSKCRERESRERWGRTGGPACPRGDDALACARQACSWREIGRARWSAIDIFAGGRTTELSADALAPTSPPVS